MSSPGFPWLFPYVEDLTLPSRYPQDTDREAFRPLVEVGFRARDAMEQRIPALVDSGSEHTLAAPWIARAIGIDMPAGHRRTNLRLGGESVEVFFHDVMVRMHAPAGSNEDFIEWDCEVGFLNHFRVSAWSAVLGQVGFFDRFTVTMQRSALTLAVEGPEAFDERFAPLILQAEERRHPKLP